MTQKNRYFKRSKLSEAKFRQIVRYFAMDLTATDCAELCGLSLRSVNSIYLRMRARMAEHCEACSPFVGELEADESYFGPRRVRGLRGRGAGRKTVVFGLLKRGDCVYTEIVPDASKRTLQAIIRGKADIASVIHTDRCSVHVNGIESFWSYAKRRLAQFNGVPSRTFYLHLKETEFRFNHRHQNLHKALLSLLRNNPL